MKLLKIIQFPNSVLFSKTQTVTEFNNDIGELIDNLIYTSKYYDNCVGLAAIQVGIPLKLAVLKSGTKYIAIINPEIVHKSEELSQDWEGCMSVGVGDNQLYSKVARSENIIVKYQDRNGVETTKNAKGFLAHIFQHEIDHMNGKLFLSYVSDPKQIWKEKDLNRYIKINNSMP